MITDLLDPADTLRLLAAGLMLQHRACRQGSILDARDERERTVTPRLLLRAQARISRLQIASGQLASADSLHRLVADCCRPLGAWAPAALLDGREDLADLVLIDPELRGPTQECLDLGQEGQNLPDFKENEWHEKLRSALSSVILPEIRGEAYTRLRQFIVGHPAATTQELNELTDQLDDLTLMPLLGPLVREMYRQVSGRFDTPVQRCARCGSLIEDTALPRCSSLRCREDEPVVLVKDTVSPANLWQLRGELILYWVNPGREELRLFQALSGVRSDVVLYPNEDEVDIGVGGERQVGLDLKDYASIPTLARRFRKGVGELAFYARSIVVVTDRGSRVRGETRRDQLRETFAEQDTRLEVMTVHDVLNTFGKPGAV